jgi:hypothetical protein
MVLVPIGSGTTTSASDTKQESAVSNAWKGTFEKAQSERSGSSVNPTTIAGAPGIDVFLPPPDLGPQAPPVFGPFGPITTGPASPVFGPFGGGPHGGSVEPPTEPTGPFGGGPFGGSVEPPTEPTGPFGGGPFGGSVEPPTEPTGPFGGGPHGGSVEPPTEPTGPFGGGPHGGSVEPPGTEPTPPGTEPTPLWVNNAKASDGRRPTPPKDVREIPEPTDPKKKGELTGEPEEEDGDSQKREGIKLQNQSGVVLTEHGINVEYLPKTNQEHQPSPDVKINDQTPTTDAKGRQRPFNAPNQWQTADVKSPISSDDSKIAEDIKKAHTEQGVSTVVLNLNRTRANNQQVVTYLKGHPIQGVNTIYVISKGNQTVTRLSWNK